MNRILSPFLGRTRLGVVALCFLAGTLVGFGKSVAKLDRKLIDFNREIRPILAENCLTCHGPDKSKRKGGLRLDFRADATATLESGHRAVVPGDTAGSEVLKVIVSKAVSR